MPMNAALLIRGYLNSRKNDMLKFVEKLVQINSHATQPEGIKAVGDEVCRELEEIGFVTERVRGRRLPPAQQWLEEFMLPSYDFSNIGDHRIARWQGAGRGKVLLLGDLDTAFLPEKWKDFSFHVQNEKAYGPGIADMKGGLTVAIYALKALNANNLNNFGQVTCVFSSDEQAGSLTSRQFVEEAARDANWVFCMECARDGGNLMGSRAQIGVAKLETFGREAHAGSAFAKGVNAIEVMARKITAVHALTDPARDIYLSIGQIKGGWRRSVIPGNCWASIDIRTPGKEAWEEIEESLHKIAEREELPGSSSSLLIASHRPGVPWTEKTDQLISITKQAGNELGIEFGVLRSPAAGSSAFVGPLGVPCLDGMGPVGGDLMTEREHIIIPTLVDRAALLAATIHKLGLENGRIKNG
jgi:glutamate carboxypeptidase